MHIIPLRRVLPVLFTVLFITSVNGQPIPVEFMAGNQYGSVNLSFSKSFSQSSRLGFFHMNTVQFYYGDETRNSFILQDLLYFEAFKNFRLAGGVAYSKGGFSPTAGFQYVLSSERLLFLCAPRVNIENEPSYDIMTIVQLKHPLGEKTKLFSRVQLLNVFNSGGNIKSYQWVRLGLDIKNFQFGLALNLDEYGPSPSVEGSLGVFVRKELF